jgi:putative transposase
MDLIAEAESQGASFEASCKTLGVGPRTVARWQAEGACEDQRKGPNKQPAHALSSEEREQIVKVATSPEFRDLSPKQIVPRLADEGVYLGSESTFYRVLADEAMLAHREHSKPRTHHKPRAHTASGPGQVWTWDITYLRACVKGTFYYLYLVLDIFSRKIVAAEVHEEESGELAEAMVEATCKREGIDGAKLTLHSDNGAPMKASTMLATLQRLGIAASFSRPAVSDDNAFVEALFRTLKFRPGYPRKPFESVAQAQQWVDQFVAWYNEEHLHSSLRFVTPSDRHQRKDPVILKARSKLYAVARAANPNRWTGKTRNWTPIGPVTLNPTSIQACTIH